MKKKRALSLYKETVRQLDESMERAGGGNSFLCSYTCFSCSCQYPTRTAGTDCCH